ncbi:hypothetical protein FHW83_005846 [Duganella sp. SG902]|uniref:DUF3800 domain-containing protein n=1 Tax=Duganella sp. SG902 TaxID=2587016 RepID=UPI00159D2221|nr:DUF3800 domain-containing protein [Duganella sp. SG902]NVM80002.1 hypothetical protein [Duganella sp. SG902]
MHIFIDESGIFSADFKSPSAWSTVGGVAIPDASLDLVGSLLENLKKAHNLKVSDEFKRNRPDCSSDPYQDFLKSLDDVGCTLHALSTRTSPLTSNNLGVHKSLTISAIRNYAAKHKDIAPHSEMVAALVQSLEDQEYNQCMLQAQIICNMLPKIISYYASVSPSEIGRFKWVIDRKGIKENPYERGFKELYIGLTINRSMKNYSPLIGGRDYSAFNQKFSPNVNTSELAQNTKEDLEIDIGHIEQSLLPVDFGALLKDEFSLEDSTPSVGLQVADLLISSVNRCLKRNYTNNEKMATALGRLMINAPRIEERSLMVLGYGPTRPIANAPGKLINLMDASSKQLYNEVFRRNFSKNVQLQ